MKQKLKRLLIFLLVLASVVAGKDFNTTGTTGFVFLNLPNSARFASMGETGITMNGAGADGIFVNPGLLARARNHTDLTVTHGQWYGDTQHQSMAIMQKFGNMGVLGVSLNYFNFGEIAKTRTVFPAEISNITAGDNNLYYDLGTYTAGAYALGLTYSRFLTLDFSFGATAKYVREMIDEHDADNILLDLGFVYNTGVGSLRIGTFLKNFGLEAEYVNEQFKMPQRLVLGISGEVFGTLESANYATLYIEAIHPNDAGEHIHVGIENKLLNVLFLRGGYKFGYDHENLTLGLGTDFVFKARHLRFDLSYMNHEYLEETLRYSLSMEL
ncbi:MAG: PorV/PorQ family protein [Candidatus Marinimicrobia bacterium]|nr:PorV/PorQ family protein [Candidatus Neomarinimicrobiota bacterium]